MDRRERLSTGVMGASLVGGGATLRNRGVEHAHALVGKPEPKLGPFRLKGLQVARAARLPGSGKAKALYGLGSAMGLVGTPALAVAVANPKRKDLYAKRDDRDKGFLASGLKGTESALRQRAESTRQIKDTPKGVYGLTLGVSGGAAIGGSQLAHHAFNRLRPASKLRHPATAIAGIATGATVGRTVSNKLLRNTDYVMTPTGVRRKRAKPVPPSSKAMSFEGRTSHGADPRAYRMQTVGKNDPGGSDLHVPGVLMLKKRKQRVAKLQAAPGMTPEQTQAQLKARRRAYRVNAVAGGLGATGAALLVAPRIHHFAPHAAKIERAAFRTAVAGGGVGALNTAQGVRIQRRDVKAQEKALRVTKALVVPGKYAEDPLPVSVLAKAAWGPQVPTGLLRPKVPRESYVATRRYAGGVLKPMRVKAAMA